jgi:hypothetical protein
MGLSESAAGRLLRSAERPGAPAHAPARMDPSEVSIPDRVPPRASRDFSNPVTRWIERNLRWFVLVIPVVYFAAYNGQWRMGQDSSIYRGIARSLATGQGYTFGDGLQTRVYPGLPLLLGGCYRLVGESTWLPVLLILLMGLATLWVTWRLLRLHYPSWIAGSVVVLMAFNARYLQLCHELLTEIPYMFGLVCALYGLERARQAPIGSNRAPALLLTALGLALAASMRPTFWVLGGSLALVAVVGLFTHHRRSSAILLLVLGAVWVTVVALDPRSRGFAPLAVGYEEEALWLMGYVRETVPAELGRMLADQMPAAFFGEQLAPFSVVGSLLVIGAGAWVLRRHLLWGVLIYSTILVTILLSSEPRYYTVILPLLLLGWVLALVWICRLLPAKWGTALLAGGLLLVLLNNISASVGFFREQRSTPFAEKYQKGRLVPALQLAESIRAHVAPGERVLAPWAHLLTYLTERKVVSSREVFGRASPAQYPAAVAEKKVEFAVFPAVWYRSKEPIIGRMMEKRILVPGTKLADVSPQMYIARLGVVVPKTDWRGLPRTFRPPEGEFHTTEAVAR